MALKTMSIEKLLDLKNRVEATLSSKVLEQRRTLQSELSKLTHFSTGQISVESRSRRRRMGARRT
jgi:hypothetical protein